MSTRDGDVEVLARAMIGNFPADAADRATLRSNTFFALGRIETSTKWMQVSEEIERIQAGQAQRQAPQASGVRPCGSDLWLPDLPPQQT